MTSMTDHELVRQQSFECDGPIDIDIELSNGTVEVVLGDPVAADTIDAEDAAAAGTTAETGDVTADDTFAERGFADDTFAGDVRSDDVRSDDLRSEDDGPRSEDFAAEDVTVSDGGVTAGSPAPDGASASDPITADDGASRPAIVVEVRAEPRSGDYWGLSGLLNWVGSQFGGGQPKGGGQGSAPFGNAVQDLAEQAVRETVISVRGNRLSVRGPKTPPLRSVALSIVVRAPAGSSLEASCGAADIRVDGDAGRVHIDAGSGDVSVHSASGPVEVKTGSGDLRLGTMLDGVSARSGSGGIEVATLTGDGALHSGSGDIWLGSVLGEKVTVRTGSGDLTVADAAAGRLQLTSGSGDLRVGIRSGVTAELDVTSGSGRTRSDLPMSDSPPATGSTTLFLRARTGSGEAVIGSATA